jgi:hypothetical protein|tara:strand:+ start:654 stop:1049 length:396 start_codon:yes stop_codon:yes gene_type:complete
MKKKKPNIKTIIRKIVREEVAMAIKEVITELKQPTQQVTQKPIQEKKNFSKNSILNDVLNETAQDGEWKTLGGSEFTSDRMNELVGKQYGDMVTNQSPTISVDGQTPDFLKKDYREVLKKTEEKSKMKNGR